MLRGLTAACSLCLLSMATHPSPEAGTDGIGAEIRIGEAVIWYLGHCGYAVKTRGHLLIFDYIELEEKPAERGLSKGFIDPSEIAGLDVAVFVSHSHVDHYDKIILGWKDRIEKIRYFFGWDCMKGDGVFSLEGPRDSVMMDDMDVYTVNSHHSGVPEAAYLVLVDGLSVFHGGDYQGRMGTDAPSNASADMKYLMTKTRGIDLFFLGAWTGDPYLEIIRGLRPKSILPMHYRKNEGKYAEFAAELKEKGLDMPVFLPTKRGDRTDFNNGKVQIK